MIQKKGSKSGGNGIRRVKRLGLTELDWLKNKQVCAVW
jgi:hypothetical protein